MTDNGLSSWGIENRDDWLGRKIALYGHAWGAWTAYAIDPGPGSADERLLRRLAAIEGRRVIEKAFEVEP